MSDIGNADGKTENALNRGVVPGLVAGVAHHHPDTGVGDD